MSALHIVGFIIFTVMIPIAMQVAVTEYQKPSTSMLVAFLYSNLTSIFIGLTIFLGVKLFS